MCGVDRESEMHSERIAGGKQSVDEYLNDDVMVGSCVSRDGDKTDFETSPVML